MASTEHVRQNEMDELKTALRDLVGVTNRLALRVIVLEATAAEIIGGMPQEHGRAYSKKLKSRIEEMMLAHSNRLLPLDDAEIALATHNLLKHVR